MNKMDEINEGNDIVTIWPDFAPEFLCKADQCRHSCCRGWEIDIDAATAAWYLTLDGEIGEDLRKNIVQAEDGTYSFRLTADESCPFLQKNGLCRLILELGEDALGEICTMHPRFFVMCGMTELAGFGLACEKAVELLFRNQAPLTFFAEGSPELRLDFPSLLAKLGLSAAVPAFRPELRAEEIHAVLQLMQQTEPIDEIWTAHIASLLTREDTVLQRAQDYAKEFSQANFDRLQTYILYRQLGRTAQFDFSQLLSYTQVNVRYIFLETAVTGDFYESVRRWSEQIEYSEENTDFLLRSAKF
ncbi:MAG: Lysine-N-methylase [Mitsuokella multacida]|jgi:lysine-N-methylase